MENLPRFQCFGPVSLLDVRKHYSCTALPSSLDLASNRLAGLLLYLHMHIPTDGTGNATDPPIHIWFNLS